MTAFLQLVELTAKASH